MLAIAGGILLALFVLGLILGGFSMIGEGQQGCGCIILIAAAVILGMIFL
jgi:hypothetical protein